MLAFDTCLDKTYTVLRTEDNILSSETIRSDEKNYHSAYLFSSIRSLLKSNGKAAEDIDVIAVNAGPGSFTGIRACLAAAKVMSSQINCKTIGLSSLEILSRAGGMIVPRHLMREEIKFISMIRVYTVQLIRNRHASL